MSYSSNITVNEMDFKENPVAKVLVVDDSPIMLNLIKDVLTLENYQVDTAENGAQALDKYEKFKPDVVTLDLSMPVMDGYEALTRILRLDKDARAIIITGLEHEILQRCLEKGAAGYLMKPFNSEQLIAAIKNASKIGSDKNLTALFYQASNKIETTIRKLYDPQATIVLKDLNVSRQESVPKMGYSEKDLSQIKSVPKIVTPLEVEVPKDTTGYVCEFNGQQNGMIVSFIKLDDLSKLFGIYDIKNDSAEILEFFSIVNCKILSSLAQNTNRILYSQPTRLYDPTEDGKNVGKTVVKASFEIKSNNSIIPLEVQLWL
ncbi:MAG: response regulator [Nitrosopumilaceae archaeon]